MKQTLSSIRKNPIAKLLPLWSADAGQIHLTTRVFELNFNHDLDKMRTQTEPGSFFAQVDIDSETDTPHGNWTIGVVETDEDGLTMTFHNHATDETHHINGITAENLDELNALTSLYRIWAKTQRRSSPASDLEINRVGHRDNRVRAIHRQDYAYPARY